MIRFSFVLAFLVCGTQMLLGQVASDKLENGYQGKPKLVTTYHYNRLNKENGEWVLNNEYLYFKEQRVLDEKGNLQEKRYWDMSLDKVNPNVIVKMHYTNGIKDSFTKFDGEGNKIGVGKIGWLNSRTYTIVFTDEKEIGSTTFFLAQNFRDSSRIAKVLNEDSVVYKRTNVNAFDAKGELKETVVSDLLAEEFYTLLYVDKEKDKLGNWINYAILRKDSGELSKYIVQEFEYYE